MIRSLGGRTPLAHAYPPIAVIRPKSAGETADVIGPGFVGCTPETFDTADSSTITADLPWMKAADVTTGDISTVPANDWGEIISDTLGLGTPSSDYPYTHVRPTIELSGPCATVHATITPPSTMSGVIADNVSASQAFSVICRDTMGQVASSNNGNFCGWHFYVWRTWTPTNVIAPFDPVESDWYATILIRRGSFFYWWDLSGVDHITATQTNSDNRVIGIPTGTVANIDHTTLAGLTAGDVLRLDVAGAGGSTTADAYVNDVLVYSAPAAFITALESAHPDFLSDMETYGTQGGLTLSAQQGANLTVPPYDMTWDDYQACTVLPGTGGDPFLVGGIIDGGGA